MTENDRPDFDRAIATLAITTRENSITEDVFEVYFSALQDLEITPVVNAIMGLAKTAKFFPKVGEIRELVRPTVPPYRQKFLDGEVAKAIGGAERKQLGEGSGGSHAVERGL